MQISYYLHKPSINETSGDVIFYIEYFEMRISYTHTCHFIRNTVPGRIHFSEQSTVDFKILVHVDIFASHNCYRFIIQNPFYNIPKVL